MKLGNILLIVVILGVFYALMILPQRRQQKNRANMMKQLQPGSRVVTSAGIYGEVTAMGDSTLHVEIAPDTVVEMDLRAVTRVLPQETSDEDIDSATEDSSTEEGRSLH
ncbi:preprotein translocase subunit YajC [Alicyclobacillaceae bacterium I2511]|nr:preprotein translocase subunit YajC [Alicyclobacillaceae bacterium I2511]